MNPFHQYNLIFVGTKGDQPVIHWPGVALGFLVFVTALTAGTMLGWYFMSLATGANFIQGIAATVAISFGSAAAAVTAVVNGTLRRSVSELPSLD